MTSCAQLSIDLAAVWFVCVGSVRALAADTLRDSSAISERLDLRQSELLEVRLFPAIGDSGDAFLSAEFSIYGTPIALTLQRFSNRSRDYQLFAQIDGGGMVEIEPGTVNTYRGSVDGIDGSVVAATLHADGLHAVLLLPDGGKVWLEPSFARAPDASANLYALYRNEDSTHADLGCMALVPPSNTPSIQTQTLASGECTVPEGLFLAELAADADVEYFQNYGSVAEVEAQINGIINVVNLQYERDLSIRHIITQIIVRTAEPDPYTQTDAAALLQEMKSHWDSQQVTVHRDVAQLFTGKQLNDTTIEVAWIGGLTSNTICGNYGYSVVESDCPGSCTTFAAKTDLSAHALGHNWGADHCACPGWTMNPTITAANRFHPVYDVPEMTTFRDSRQCLDTTPICDDGDPCNGVEACDQASGACVTTFTADCNGNAIEDACDISGGTSADANHNGVPDECEPGACCAGDGTCSVTMQAACSAGSWSVGLACAPNPCAYLTGVEAAGCRYLRVTPNPTANPNMLVAIRVDRSSPSCTPKYVVPDGGLGRLIDFPLYLSPGLWGTSLVTDTEVVPGATYSARTETAQGMSNPVAVTLPRWGDVRGASVGSPPDGAVNFQDISAIVARFQGSPSAPPMERCDLYPAVTDQLVNFLDVSADVDAFKGKPYPFSTTCP